MTDAAAAAARRQAAQTLYSLLWNDSRNIYASPSLYPERFRGGVLGDIQARWWEEVIDKVQYRG